MVEAAPAGAFEVLVSEFLPEKLRELSYEKLPDVSKKHRAWIRGFTLESNNGFSIAVAQTFREDIGFLKLLLRRTVSTSVLITPDFTGEARDYCIDDPFNVKVDRSPGNGPATLGPVTDDEKSLLVNAFGIEV